MLLFTKATIQKYNMQLLCENLCKIEYYKVIPPSLSLKEIIVAVIKITVVTKRGQICTEGF